MVKDLDIRNGDIVLLEAMAILHECVQNLSKLPNSFCCSPSGCLLSRVVVNAQGVAIGENMFQHFVLSSIAELFSGGQSLQGSDRSFLRHRRRIVLADASSMSLQGSDRSFLRHRRRIVLADTASMSLQGSDRSFLRHRRRIVLADASSMSLQGSDRYSPVA